MDVHEHTNGRRLLTSRETARLLHTGLSTVYELVHAGELVAVRLHPHARNGRFRFEPEEIQRLIERHKVGVER
jgi:excisionase family DNA binding protein